MGPTGEGEAASTRVRDCETSSPRRDDIQHSGATSQACSRWCSASSLGAVLSWSSFGSALGPSFFYPSAGVTVAAMLLTRRTLWPAILAAIFAGRSAGRHLLPETTCGRPPVRAGEHGGAADRRVGAARLVRWPADLRKRRDLTLFIAGPP